MAVAKKQKKAAPSGSVWRQVKRNRHMYLMILPIVIFFALFAYWPMYYLRMAFYDYNLLAGFERSPFVGFDNFIRFFTTGDALKIIWNTLAINFLALLFLFPSPIILALLLNEIKTAWFKKSVQTISYLPHFLSTVMLVSFITLLLSPTLSPLKDWFGESTTNIIGDPNYFRTIQVVSGLWQTVGWNSIVYVAALSGVDPQLYEAAKIDGAGRLKRILHVTLPAIAPTIIIMLIMQIGQILGSNFEKVYLMQTPTNLEVSEVLATYVYKKAMTDGKYGLSTAAGLFNSIVSLILVVIANTITKKLSDTSLW